MKKGVTFKQKETCYGCGKEHYELPIKALFTGRKFCTRACLETNYFNNINTHKNESRPASHHHGHL